MLDPARRPRRIPSILLAVCIAGLLGATSAFAGEDAGETLDGPPAPPSSRFT
jgi:hypothetical protein